MKHNRCAPAQNQEAVSVSHASWAADLQESLIDFVPSVDEVARRAYSFYVNQGSLPGHDVQDWLEAQRELLEERKLTRAYAFRNPS
jgi:hypothetical protein